MRPIPVGAKGKAEIIVGPDHLASNVKSALLPPVLATPVMILLMENAALEAVRGYLEESESCVGSHVDVAHLAATPAGKRVTAEATVTAVEGRRIRFDVTARDEAEEVGRGTHERVVIDMAGFSERLGKK